MADIEKVIKGLECHQIDKNHRINCADCPYYVDNDEHIRCVNDLHDDALAMLKEQEAIKPKSKTRHGSTTMVQHWCGNCMVMLHGKPKYCPNCGRKVKWE